MKTIILFTVLILIASCGARRVSHQAMSHTAVRDSIIYKTDTVRIAVAGGMVRVQVHDTISVRDTIWQKDPKSGLMVRLWRDRFNLLNAECSKRDTTAKAEIKYVERYKTIENTKEIPVNVVPVWVWLAFGALGITLIYSFLKR